MHLVNYSVTRAHTHTYTSQLTLPAARTFHPPPPPATFATPKPASRVGASRPPSSLAAAAPCLPPPAAGHIRHTHAIGILQHQYSHGIGTNTRSVGVTRRAHRASGHLSRPCKPRACHSSVEQPPHHTPGERSRPCLLFATLVPAGPCARLHVSRDLFRV